MAESVSETSKQKNLPGVYRHPDTGVELVAKQHPKYGSAQADGYVRVGFVYVGPVAKDSDDKKGTK